MNMNRKKLQKKPKFKTKYNEKKNFQGHKRRN